MKRLLLAGAALVTAIFGMSPAAYADSPNFHYADSSIITATGALSVSFKETGLGTTVSTEKVTLSVTLAKATYQCWNNGGNHPKAGNKETVQQSLTTSGTFPVRNGQTTGSIKAGPVSPGSFTCPSGQNMFLMAVYYSGIYVTGSAGDTLEATPDPIWNNSLMLPV